MEIAPTSNAGAGRKVLDITDYLYPGTGAERLTRLVRRLAAEIERGDITPRTLHSLRAMKPAAMSHDAETYNDGATAKALTHAINWCARLWLV
jgi:hypothetical protein